MKKFFTLIAAVTMAASMNAQSEWNFSNWDAKTYSETFTKDGLTLNINKNSKGEDAPMTIDGSKKTVDDVKYTQRLKLSGSGSVSDLENLVRVVSFDVEGPGDIYVVAAHASSSGDPRVLKVAAVVDNDITPLEDVSFDPSEIKSFTANYNQNKAAKILIYSGKSGMNIYDIKFTPAKVSNGISNINVDSAKAGKTYNMAGQQVSGSFKGLVIKNGKKYVK